MKTWRFFLPFLFCAGLATNTPAATFTVTNLNDSGPGSLRQAIADANATPGKDIVQFSILPGGPKTIALSAAGLAVTDPITIDGSTQPGFAGKPIIVVTGRENPDPGLRIATSNCLIRALVISNFAGSGVVFEANARDNVIGGTNNGAGNVVVANLLSGVVVSSGTNNAIRGNSIFGNGALGIDLGDDGVTTDDNRDPDSGADQLQNYPILSSATISSNSVVISGSLNSLPSTTFQIDFFANQACDESGYGEGQFYLGTRSVTTANNGIVSFNFTLTVVVAGRYFTASATDPLGNTSEFSPCLRANSTIPPLTFSVVNTNDSGPGSLRQAILDANARVASGTNTVNFSIPGTDLHTVALASPLPTIFDSVVIDGYTQPGAVPNTLSNGFTARLLIRVDGSNAGAGSVGLVLRGDNSTIRGLVMIGFQGGGIQVLGARSNAIQGNLIGLDVDNSPLGNGIAQDGSAAYPGVLLMASAGSTIGGATPADRNIISANGTDGVEITGAASTGNQVLGNLIGTDATGTVGLGNGNWGVNLDGASTNVVGGTAAGAGNLISWNGNGVLISVGVSNRVQGNLIGCDVTGTNALGNGSGIVIIDSSYNLIGGTNATARNVIVANGAGGISAVGTAISSNIIQGNFIGTDAAGRLPLGNGAFGIHFDTGDANLIGGTTPGAGNTIAFNGGNGVEIGDGARNAILRNSIFGNAGLGIDLGNDGVTLNDAGDTDSGANGLQNSPELISTIFYTNRAIVRGRLVSRTGTYGIQLFDNGACNDSGYGEGQIYLTNLNIAISAGGQASFSYTNSTLLQIGHYITATATDSSNNTSEFSACMKLVPFDSIDLAVTQVDSADPLGLSSNLTYTITVSNNGPTNATGVVLTDTLPAAVNFVSATASQGSCSNAAGVVTCRLNTINQGASATITVTVHGTRGGLIENVALVAANQVDNTPENNIASESTLLGITDLAVAITDSPDPARTGEILTYSVTITNHGPDPATGVGIAWLTSPTLPQYTIASAEVSQGRVMVADGTAEFGAIPIHGTATLTLRIVPFVVETYQLVANVSSMESDPDPINNVAEENTTINAGPGVVELDDADPTINERGGAVTITLFRVGGDLGTVGVSYATSNGTATAGTDYVATTGTINFVSGETAKTVSVPILDNTISECNKTFTLQLFDPTGFPVLVGRTSTVVVIFDDDITPQGLLAGVSVTTNNPQAAGNAASSAFSISSDGRWVAFASSASDLAAGDTNGASDIFVRDLTSGATRLVSANRFGTGSGNVDSDQPAIAANGRCVAFFSHCSDLVTNNTLTLGNVFVRDLMTDRTTLVSLSTNTATGGNSSSQDPAISSNGLAITFASYASDLAALPNPNSTRQVFVRDLTSMTSRLVSVNRFGTAAANGESFAPRISANGRYVAFESDASDLVAGDMNGYSDVFVRDLTNGTTLLINVNSSGLGSGNGISCCASLSADGRYVVFYSDATDLVVGGSETSGNIFVRDLVLGTTRLVSANTNGIGANGGCRNSVISADGQYIVFVSDASDLMAGDSNGQSDIFVRDLVAGITTLASVNCDGTGPGNAASDSPLISADGRSVAFLSLANNLTPGEFPPGRWQVFRRDLGAGTTTLLSVNTNRIGGGSDSAAAVALSADGHTAVFASTASDLVPDDQNGAQDIFSWSAGPPGAIQPRLSIQRVGESLILEWPAETPPGFVLETTTNLTPPATWDVISNATSPFVVTNTPADRGRFYRMRMP